MRVLAIALVFVAACAGDSPPATGRCTGQLYDACSTEDDCRSALCQNFANEFQVCSQACSEAQPCPSGAECDEFNVCKPAAPNDCEL